MDWWIKEFKKIKNIRIGLCRETNTHSYKTEIEMIKPVTIDTCRLLGNYNGENIYLYSSAKYDRLRLFYTPNYYYLTKWVVDHDKLTWLQAVKI